MGDEWHWHQVLDADDALEYQLRVGIAAAAVYHSRAVDQEDALHQRNVLPHLGLPWNGGRLAHLLGAQNLTVCETYSQTTLSKFPAGCLKLEAD